MPKLLHLWTLKFFSDAYGTKVFKERKTHEECAESVAGEIIMFKGSFLDYEN